MSGDQDVRHRALTPDQSFLVEAPAGSGKTELLIQRYLRLLAVVKRPESVVAMTFTRKAAAEMKERVLQALLSATAGKPVESGYAQLTRGLANAVLDQDRLHDWRLLEDASRLQIQTIDSLCAMLTRQMPLLAGFGSPPEVIEHAEHLYRLAARRAIVRLAETSDLQPIFRDAAVHFDGNLIRFEEQIANMLAKRDQWTRALETRDSASLRAEIEATLRECMEDRLKRAWDLWPKQIPGKPPASLEVLGQWCALAEEFLLKGKAEARKKPHGGILEGLPEFCKALHEARLQPPERLSEEQCKLIADFSTILRVALYELEDVFRERAQVDFTRITQAAVAALGSPDRPTDLAYRLDYRIEHLLVDEFQDTSLVQYELLDRLTAQWSLGDGRTLFAVGDPMQSIYRFRDAEVSLFMRAGERRMIGSVPVEPLRLTSNFRSQRAIVQWINETFREVMPAEDNAAYGDVALREAFAARGTSGPAPVLHAFIDDDGTREAARVVELAREALKQGSAAILVRTRPQLRAILPALREAQVPYEAIDIDALTDEQHTLDLLALTRAIHHRSDRLSWLACLRAPWCGLTLSDLLQLAGDAPKECIFDLLSDLKRVARLSIDGRSRAARFQKTIANALLAFGRYPVREVVEAAWVALGGPAALASENQRQDAQNFFDLLDEFGPSGMIQDFGALEERLRFLFAKPHVHAGQLVQVMTIHAAKGLEFDTVIVPQLHAGARSGESELLVWTERLRADGSEGLLIAGLPRTGDKDPFYRFVGRELQIKESAENKRLLYVASTRAKEQLHLLGCVASNSKQDGYKKPSRCFLSMLWHVAEPVFDKAWSRFVQEHLRQRTLPLTATPQTTLRRLPEHWILPIPEPAAPWRPPFHREVPSEREITYEWVSDTGRHVGTVVHDFLRRIAEEGVAHWTSSRVDSHAHFVTDELRRMGVARSELAAATDRAVSSLKHILSSERGRWILSPHNRAECEWALTGIVGDRLEAGRIDRTFIDETGRRWIVDYKTGAHEGADRESFLRQEQRRYRPQLETYASLLQQAGESTVSVGLYFPLLDEWIAWEVPAGQSVAEPVEVP
ncbi:MAG TPA: UvrD-helicase domain-containing protein [Bryobacteraceae bacterium]|nr:UvrD-helicase domain-containing protein [Bryobacteraceae bacterium]